MFQLTTEAISSIADSRVIFNRGRELFRFGTFQFLEHDREKGSFVYEVDGSYGNYHTEVRINGGLETYCDCPYPGSGCKHVVAVLFDLMHRGQDLPSATPPPVPEAVDTDFLLSEEIREQALADRRLRAAKEDFKVIRGDMFKGDHLVETHKGRQYQVTMHDPAKGLGHCSCPDFQSNRLGVCKHLLFLADHLRGQKNFARLLEKERFPYVDIFWDAQAARPRVFHQQPQARLAELGALLERVFDSDGLHRSPDLADFMEHVGPLTEHKQVRIQDGLMQKLSVAVHDRELSTLEREASFPDVARALKIVPYRYQEEGVRFGLFKRATLIGDEMGLGKTMQAIALAVLKKEVFGFSRVLVVTLSSLKEQWRREIERFTHEKAVVIAGPARQRRQQYRQEDSLFKITNYEAVLRDVTVISRFKPDLIILDEAQRIKNFETKTAEAVKSLPRLHSLVLTGTPLENKLEDVYSIVQFLDPELLSPLWRFAADHFLLSRKKKGQILGYRNLDVLHQKLKPLVIRRRKEDVLDQLPDQIQNDYFLDLHEKQAEIHAGFSSSLLPLLNKKFLTPMDMRRIQMLLLKMRQVCDSTHLIDRESNISPKLDELGSILDELVVQNGRKVVIFSEWTTMTFLIGKHLSQAGIPFVELSGKVPVAKRQCLIDEFTNNAQCKVFLSTDAGGTGLNLQAADCVINFELPWNPAKLNQRVGRVNRIGQQSSCINVINLISKRSIEERILAGIKLKSALFDGVFDGGDSEVMFSREKRQELVNRLRELMGEEQEPIQAELMPTEELPDDTPHYLNPEALRDREPDYVGEEDFAAESPEDLSDAADLEDMGDQADRRDAPDARSAQQSPEKMEAVLNQGMAFISGLLEMATGQKIAAAEEGKMIELDKQTGEVTLKFTLPGFGRS
jgi:superfamily II DNA or RNA helicase